MRRKMDELARVFAKTGIAKSKSLAANEVTVVVVVVVVVVDVGETLAIINLRHFLMKWQFARVPCDTCSRCNC